ncbi:hypothetical protein EIP86_009957 [Pleurotus ostreatoroseus]|nr:hypothetical protein EIP86_009957 [Pleurotus ostreatoroseus]
MYEPPSLDVINAIFQYSDDKFDVKAMASRLGALLNGIDSSDEAVRPRHSSLQDFLTDRTRSGVFYVDVSAGHECLAQVSLRIMDAELRFNIGKLSSSYQFNVTQDLHKARALPEHLSYAYRFWCHHLEASPLDRLNERYLAPLKIFLGDKLLLWLECLSLLDAMRTAVSALSYIAESFPTIVTLHVCKPQEIPGRGIFETIAFSPDSSPFASPSHIGTAVVQWDIGDRATLVPVLFRGHSDDVKSVAYSPDGAHIVSFASNHTIRIWKTARNASRKDVDTHGDPSS